MCTKCEYQSECNYERCQKFLDQLEDEEEARLDPSNLPVAMTAPMDAIEALGEMEALDAESDQDLADLPGLAELIEMQKLSVLADTHFELSVGFDRAVSAVGKVNEALAAGDFETVRAEVALLLLAVGERQTELAGRLEVAA